ncbi:MAG: GNAT family N-acyltransferase [Roseobacter sp.]
MGEHTMTPLHRGRYRAIFSQSADQVKRAQAFRAQCFEVSEHLDADGFDAHCQHVLIEEENTGELVSCFRLLEVTGDTLPKCYSAQFYDLASLSSFKGPMLEMGRFCIDAGRTDPDILRLAWVALASFVDHRCISFLFGCSSFQGTDPAPYADALARLKMRNLAPECWAPGTKAEEIYPYARLLQGPVENTRALLQTPSLLRSYLNLGAWVSDHAVIDRALNTLHVFTGLEMDAIPPQRKQLLRAALDNDARIG